MSTTYAYQSFTHEPIPANSLHRLGPAEKPLRDFAIANNTLLYWTLDKGRDLFIVEAPGSAATPIFLLGLRDIHFSAEFQTYSETVQEVEGKQSYRLEYGGGALYLPHRYRDKLEEMQGLTYEAIFAHRQTQLERADAENGTPGRGVIKSVDISFQTTKYFDGPVEA